MTSGRTSDPLDLFRERVAAILSVPNESVEVDLDGDLLSPDGYEVAGQILDSLTLVDLVTTLEDAYTISLQSLLDRGGPLTLRDVATEITGAPLSDAATPEPNPR
jgi:acyl carrier protein